MRRRAGGTPKFGGGDLRSGSGLGLRLLLLERDLDLDLVYLLLPGLLDLLLRGDLLGGDLPWGGPLPPPLCGDPPSNL